MCVQRQPRRSWHRLHQPVRHMGAEKEPVAGDKVEALVLHLQGGPTLEQEDPFVVILVVGHRRTQGPAHDVLDHDAAELRQFLAPLTNRRHVRRWTQSTADQASHGNGFHFCTTTQQTPAAGAGGAPRLHWLVGGWLSWTSTTWYWVGPENLSGP